MRVLPTLLLLSSFAAPAPAQVCAAVAGSGQPVMAAIRPTCQNTVPLAVLCAAGNPAFALHSAVVHAAVPAGRPLFLLLGTPSPLLPIGGPPLWPGFGVPGHLAMGRILLVVPVGVSGTVGNPSFRLPLPRVCAVGHVLTAQILFPMPAAGWFGLTGATSISG